MLFLSFIVSLTLSLVVAVKHDNKNSMYREFYEDKDRCTTIGIGPKAMIDGSTVTTHNNDCQECDFRITHVPARDWPAGSKRPIVDTRDAYPRYIETAENSIHGPDYIRSKTYPDETIYNWPDNEPFTYIDQVPHTYGYTLGTYAIQNEKQLSIGESTCSAKFFAKPLFAGIPLLSLLLLIFFTTGNL